MFIERKINNTKKVVELWKCEWENHTGRAAKKVFLEKIADEQPLRPDSDDSANQAPAICWSYGRTLGNIAVFSQAMLGSFPAAAGDDALLPCDFVNAGKFRHGVNRWWCRTHQSHWGTKADHQSYEKSGVMMCANHDQPMNYVLSPVEINLTDYAEAGIWCSMPAALSTQPIVDRPPKIHVHIRRDPGGKKTIDRDFDAMALLYSEKQALFGKAAITRVNVTPPAAFEFVRGLEAGREMDCINCSSCGYPHLDLGSFAEKPHRKHFCANCGRDSTWSSMPIVSTPLKPLHDQFPHADDFKEPNRTLNLDKYAGCNYIVWASTPAILWTADRPQEVGIHVHVHDGQRRIEDNTFSEVILNGIPLKRSDLLQKMMSRTII